MSTAESSYLKVSSFLERSAQVGLILPNGWFGRPYDNFLTVVGVFLEEEHILVIEFERSFRLEVGYPFNAVIEGNVLVLSGFASARWEYFPFGETSIVRQRFTSGTCSLVSP